jgi:transcriptional regulator with XRE-family HTH domain
VIGATDVTTKKRVWVGPVLGRKRRIMNVPQARIAELAGISQPYLSMIENGKKPIDRELEQRLRHALKQAETMDL